MAESPRSKRLFLAIFAALVVLHVALLATARLYPSIDLPDHLAAAAIARDSGRATNEFSHYYRLETRFEPNTFHLFFCALKIFPSVELANRLFFCIFAALLPLSVLLIIRKAGGNPWFSLFSFLLMYNVDASWGFVGFAFAIPLVLLFYRFFLLEPGGLSSPLRRVLAAAALLSLFFMHLLAALFALVLLFLCAVWRGRRSAGRTLSSVVVGLPLAAFIVLWWHSHAGEYTDVTLAQFLSSYYPKIYVATFASRWGVLAFDNLPLREGATGIAIALVFSSAIVISALALFVVGRVRGPGPTRDPGRGPAPDESAPRPLVAPLLVGSLLCVLILPNEIPRQQILYERYSPLLLLSLAIVAGTAAAGRGRRLFAWLIPALCAIHLALWAEYFVSFNRENASFNASFLPDAAGGKKLAGIVYDYTFRGRPIYIHFPDYYIVWKEGVAPTTLIEYRFGPVRRRTTLATLPKYLDWVGRFNNLDGRYRNMDYFLVRGEVPASASKFMEGFALARASGAWSIYERTAAAP